MDFTLLPESATADELTCNMVGVPTDKSNLVIKVRIGQRPGALVHTARAYRLISV